jgi:hypothetical protein
MTSGVWTTVHPVETREIPRMFVNENTTQAELAAHAIAALRDSGGMCWVASTRSAGKLRGAAKLVLRHVPDASLVTSKEGDDQAVFTFVASGSVAAGVPGWWVDARN